jgi:CRP/FNR family cyclic AMP-dependent transcriptional regulator
MPKPSRAQITAESLLAIDLFRGLNENARRSIAQLCEGARFPAGSHIVEQKDNHTDVYCIVSGTVRVIFHSIQGKEVQFRDQVAGECFGELSAIDGALRSAEVIASTDVFVGTIKASDFLTIATNFPPVSEKILNQLASMVRSLSDRVVELSTLGVANRIHAELLRLARAHGIHENTSVIAPPPTHAEFASRVSTQREAVTKEIGRLVRTGVLSRTRGALQIPDVNRLEMMVQSLSNN